MPHLPRLLFASALLLSSGFAHAQYSWVGANGIRHFSDRPPPAGTPASKILKAPRHSNPAPAAPPAVAAAPEPQPVVTVAAPSAAPVPDAAQARLTPALAAREAAYREREKLRTENEKKEAAEAVRKRELAERCTSARQVKAQSESGMRVAKVTASGESVYLTDEEKAADAARANKALAECR